MRNFLLRKQSKKVKGVFDLKVLCVVGCFILKKIGFDLPGPFLLNRVYYGNDSRKKRQLKKSRTHSPVPLWDLHVFYVEPNLS